MIIAQFEREAEAEGFRALLADLEQIDAVVVPDGRGFAVDVLAPADFRAGLIYLLYYVRGLSLDDLPSLPRDERVAILATHLVHYAVGTRRWAPPPLDWYGRRAQLDAAGLDEARATAEAEYRTRRRGWLRRLLGR
ncbi:MAG: hypothetical protein D6689_16755 [Deltaproteobacteria bacterium]|nr:MAG: hypothetical protein D6689_16755 [Deltaproteobacteria bacterium]